MLFYTRMLYHTHTHTPTADTVRHDHDNKRLHDGEEIRSSNDGVTRSLTERKYVKALLLFFMEALGYPCYAEHISDMFNMQHKVLSLYAQSYT